MPDTEFDVTAATRALGMLLLKEESLEGTLQRVTELALQSVPADGIGLTFSPSGRARTIAAAGAPSVGVDELQYELDDGPCLQGLRDNAVVVVPDMQRETRWGDFPARSVA